MYQVLSTKLYIGASATQYSQAVSMEGGNAAFVETTVYAGVVQGYLEQSNDLENWTSVSANANTGGTITGPTYTFWPLAATVPTPEKNISAAYVRVKWVATNATILACGINISKL